MAYNLWGNDGFSPYFKFAIMLFLVRKAKRVVFCFLMLVEVDAVWPGIVTVRYRFKITLTLSSTEITTANINHQYSIYS